MAKFYAEPRYYPDGIPAPKITFTKDGGLDLEGWYVCAQDVADIGIVPTERETVAAIFRYVLDNYTEKEAIDLGLEFKALREGGFPDFEIPQGVVLGFGRN